MLKDLSVPAVVPHGLGNTNFYVHSGIWSAMDDCLLHLENQPVSIEQK